MKNPIIVSGIGCITPFGRGLKEAWSKIIRGESAFTSVSHSNGNEKTIIKHHKRAKIPDKVINSLLPSRKFLRLPRYSKLVLSTATECLKDAGIEQLKKNMDTSRIGVFLGTSRGPQEAVENISIKLVEGHPQKVNPLDFQETVYNAPLGHLSIHYGITGPCLAFSSGVASGLQALEVAVTFLSAGKIDLALVGGVDTLTEIYFRGMADVKVLSPQYGGREEVRPFASARNGTIVGEAGTFIALEREKLNHSRSGPMYGLILSAAVASDGFSYYGNEPSGKGFEYAIRQCLFEAGLTHKDINLIIACASGQRGLDCAEWRGIASIWGDDVSRVPVTSIKGISGDLGAATQLLALALCHEIYEQELIPGTFYTGPIDPDCTLKVLQRPVQGQVSTVLLNEASWGGINASIILKRP